MSESEDKRVRTWREHTVAAPSHGAVLGTLVVAANALPPTITLMGYGPDQCVEHRVESVAELTGHLGRWPVLWVNVSGLGDGQIIYQIGQLFQLHPLALEDVGHRHQRAKADQYNEHLFVVARVAEFDESLSTRQVSVFLGPDFVLTFQESPMEGRWESIRGRLRHRQGRLRGGGPDLLLHAIVDALIDGYFPVLESYVERLEQLELEIIQCDSDDAVARIHALKSELLIVRRALWPHREALQSLVRDPSPLISDETKVYLRDCYDHTVQLLDLVETYRELAAGLQDLYLSTASHRLNEVMKVLTIVSTIFIPMSFVAGVYGMNFNPATSAWNMPELSWRYGYPTVLGVMTAMVVTMLFFFRRLGWIGRRAEQRSTKE